MALFNKHPLATPGDRALLVTALMNPEWRKHCVQWTGGDSRIMVADVRRSRVYVLRPTCFNQSTALPTTLNNNNNRGVTHGCVVQLTQVQMFLNPDRRAHGEDVRDTDWAVMCKVSTERWICTELMCEGCVIHQILSSWCSLSDRSINKRYYV